MISLNADHPRLDDKLVFEKPARRTRIDDVLLPQDARGQAVGGVVRTHRYRRLDHDRTMVELGADKMDRAAVQLHARGERARVSVEARERGQQRGMDIEHAALIAGDETRREDAHEAGEDHKAWREALDFAAERGVESLAAREGAMLDHARGHAAGCGEPEPLGVGAI